MSATHVVVGAADAPRPRPRCVRGLGLGRRLPLLFMRRQSLPKPALRGAVVEGRAREWAVLGQWSRAFAEREAGPGIRCATQEGRKGQYLHSHLLPCLLRIASLPLPPLPPCDRQRSLEPRLQVREAKGGDGWCANGRGGQSGVLEQAGSLAIRAWRKQSLRLVAEDFGRADRCVSSVGGGGVSHDAKLEAVEGSRGQEDVLTYHGAAAVSAAQV